MTAYDEVLYDEGLYDLLEAADPTWSLLADFDRNGTFDTNLGTYIDEDSRMSVERGVDANGTPQATRFTVTLDNTSGAFTPEYPGSPYYGLLSTHNPVPIKLVLNWLGVDYTIFTGYAMRWKATTGRTRSARCVLTVGDIISAYLLPSKPVNITLSTSRDTDAALIAIDDLLGLSAGTRTYADGVAALPYHFARSQKAMDAYLDAWRSEMGGAFWIDATGDRRFIGRDGLLGSTPAQTWGDGTNVFPDGPAIYDLDDQDIVTTVAVIPTVFGAQGDQTEIFRLTQSRYTRPAADSLLFAAGETKTLEFDYLAPVVALVEPVATTDYSGNTAIDGTGTDATADFTVVATDLGAGFRAKITNTAAGGRYLTWFRLRGQPVQFITQTPRFVYTKTWDGVQTDRGVEIRVPFADMNTNVPRDYSVGLCRTYRYPYPKVTCRFTWINDDTTVAMASVELWDLVAFADRPTGMEQWSTYVDDLWRVVRIKHDLVTPGAGLSSTEILLVPSYLYFNLDAMAWDNFDRDNGALGTSDSGDAWANASNIAIVSSWAVPSATTEQTPNLTVGGSGDMVIEADLSNLSADADEKAGVVARYADSSNYIRAYIDDAADLLKLEKVVAGAVTSLGTYAWTAADTAEIRLMCQDDRLRVWLDAVLRIDTRDSAGSTNTKAGLYLKDSTVTRIGFVHGRAL